MAMRRSLTSTKVADSMHEMHEGMLKSGSADGPRVTNPKQAIAIGLNEARKAGANLPAPPRRRPITRIPNA